MLFVLYFKKYQHLSEKYYVVKGTQKLSTPFSKKYIILSKELKNSIYIYVDQAVAQNSILIVHLEGPGRRAKPRAFGRAPPSPVALIEGLYFD